MNSAQLVDRIQADPKLSWIPREEVEWLVEHGDLEVYEAGAVIGPKGRRLESLWLILSGQMAVRVDRGAGEHRVIQWRPGDVSGMLPYSRMTAPPGDNYMEERTEVLTVHERHFPEMVYRCPTFTARTVHLMLDRARSFNTSALQDEKMISLGKLAAGLAHELNNPASATIRGAKLLEAGLAEADAAAQALGAVGLDDATLAEIDALRAACQAESKDAVLSPMELAEREAEIEEWILGHGGDPGHAAPLAEAGVSLETLDQLARVTPEAGLQAALRWIAAGCTTRLLSRDIGRAATRIYELVGAVKRFTYMDSLPGPELVSVEEGLRDTISVLAAKAKAKGASISLDIEADLPRARANGGELNQVWMNLIDNALDAVPESGKVEVRAVKELDRVVVRVADDGPGISPDLVERIFDPFFTTKAPGEGTGLGLDLTRRLVRRYHGDLTVVSEPGSTEFRVSLVAESAGEREA